jgi:tRNA G18 (ribose-2'-O)-methylase SpoU
MISGIRYCDSLDIPELELYRTLRRPAEHRKLGIFIAEGDKVAERFFESSLTAVSILLTPEWLSFFQSRLESRPEPVRVFSAPKNLLETIVGFHCHQGVMIVGEIPQTATIEKALQSIPRPRLLAALDGLTSAENTGVLVRNCAACGVHALIVGETSADPYLRRSVRNSMGTIFRLPIVHAASLARALRFLRTDRGFQVLAAHPRPDSTPVHAVEFTKDSCVVFGHEGRGVSAEVLAECDRSIAIPMAPGVDSFNVACASAIVLYEATRQRLPD